MTPQSLSQTEKAELEKLLVSHTALKTAIDKFVDHQINRFRTLCTAVMANVPRDHETAADYAAKAQAYETLYVDLQKFVDRD